MNSSKWLRAWALGLLSDLRPQWPQSASPESGSKPGSNDTGPRPEHSTSSELLKAAAEGDDALEQLLERRASNRAFLALTLALALGSLALLAWVAAPDTSSLREVACVEAVGVDW
jgi:hypothetical protein